MRIIAFDPGATTGVAELEINQRLFTIVTHQLPNAHAVLWDTLNRMRPDIIVYEQFLHQQRIKADYTPVEMIGVIKLYAAFHEISLVGQTPATGKAFWTNDKLRTIKMPKTDISLYKTNAPHAMDALRHLLHFVTFSLNDDRFVRMQQAESSR